METKGSLNADRSYRQLQAIRRKKLDFPDGIHPIKRGQMTMTELYRRTCEHEIVAVTGDSDSEDEEQQFWMPKTATMWQRVVYNTDTQGTPVVAVNTLTPGPLLRAGTHDGTVLEKLQLGAPADPARTPVEAETPKASEVKRNL